MSQHRGVLLIGVGGLGCAVALALAGMGIRRLGLVDDDHVALSNLHRQILFQTADIGKSKAVMAGQHLLEQHTDWEIVPIPRRVEAHNTLSTLAADYQVVVDGSDNFPTRFAANDAAVYHHFPLVHGAATGIRGQLLSIAPGGQPCLRCLFGGPPPQDNAPTCRSEGVFGPLVGEVGWLMAMEAVKWIHGTGQPLIGRLLTIDVWQGKRRIVPLTPNPDCPACPDQSIGKAEQKDQNRREHP